MSCGVNVNRESSRVAVNAERDTYIADMPTTCIEIGDATSEISMLHTSTFKSTPSVTALNYPEFQHSLPYRRYQSISPLEIEPLSLSGEDR
jgi:hypothetical protein